MRSVDCAVMRLSPSASYLLTFCDKTNQATQPIADHLESLFISALSSIFSFFGVLVLFPAVFACSLELAASGDIT